MNFKRESAGKYTLKTNQGLTTINKKDDKWWITFADGKTSYRRSYEQAKKWVVTYLEKNSTSAILPIKTIAKSKYMLGNTNVKLAVTNNKQYLIGEEYLGCINTGMAACILNLEIQNTTYYLVGNQLDITDVYVNKYVAHIKYQIKDDCWLDVNNEFNFPTKNEDFILVTKSFDKAYKEFIKRNDKVVKANKKSRSEVAIAIENKDYLTLINHGIQF